MNEESPAAESDILEGEDCVPATNDAEIGEAIARIESQLTDLTAVVAKIVKRTGNLLDAFGNVSQTQQMSAAQLRKITEQIDTVGTGVSAGRFREFAGDMILFRDMLVDLNGAEHPLLKQLDQFFSAHGIEAIAEGETIDYSIHRPIHTVTTDDLERDGAIRRFVRPGYEAGGRLLRPADVEIESYEPHTTDMPRPADDTDSTDAEHDQ